MRHQAGKSRGYAMPGIVGRLLWRAERLLGITAPSVPDGNLISDGMICEANDRIWFLTGTKRGTTDISRKSLQRNQNISQLGNVERVEPSGAKRL